MSGEQVAALEVVAASETASVTEKFMRRQLSERAPELKFYLDPNLDDEELQVWGEIFALPAIVPKEEPREETVSRHMELGLLESKQSCKRSQLEAECDTPAQTKKRPAASPATSPIKRPRNGPAPVALANGSECHTPCIPAGTFQPVRYIPRDPRVDPPPQACFRCWNRDHWNLECPNPRFWTFCHNCGRRDVLLNNCPRCAQLEPAAWTTTSLAASTTQNTRPPAKPGPGLPQAIQQQKKKKKKKKKMMMMMMKAVAMGPPKPPGPKPMQAKLIPKESALPQAINAVAESNGNLPAPVARNPEVVPSAPEHRLTSFERTLNLETLRAANILLNSLAGASTVERTRFRKVILTFLERNLAS